MGKLLPAIGGVVMFGVLNLILGVTEIIAIPAAIIFFAFMARRGKALAGGGGDKVEDRTKAKGSATGSPDRGGRGGSRFPNGSAGASGTQGSYASTSASDSSNWSQSIQEDLSKYGISEEEFNAALSEGAVKLARLQGLVRKVSDQTVRAEMQRISDMLARILSNIREDPKDLRPARKFLGYYVDATIRVVDRYVSLKQRGASSSEVQASLTKTEESLGTIRKAYEKQLQQLLENDVMDLDTELQVLERTIKMEGLGED